MGDTQINRRLNPFDIFFLMRPPMLIPVWGFFLAGYWRSRGGGVNTIPGFIRSALTPDGYFWLSFVAFSLLMGAIYIINQIVDRESDRANRKLFLIPLAIVPVRLACAMVILLSLISFSAGWFFGMPYLMLLVLSLLIGILYSVRPMRFKGRPILDIISNGVGYGVIAFGVGWITGAPFTNALMVRAIPYLFAAATIFSASTILDTEGDEEDGAITTAVFFGRKATLVISLLTLLGALSSALLCRDYVIIITSVLSLPLVICALAKQKRQFVTLYMRGASYVFIVLMGILFPWFFVLLIFVFLASKYYYRYRFGIAYPKLLEKGT